MPIKHLIKFILVLWLIKVIIETIGLPLSVYCANKLKQYEGLDIYDKDTDFTLFSLNGDYELGANHHSQQTDNQQTNK